jgi:hypothetical protein
MVTDFVGTCRRLRDNDASLIALQFVKLNFGSLLHPRLSQVDIKDAAARLLKACATTPIFKDCCMRLHFKSFSVLEPVDVAHCGRSHRVCSVARSQKRCSKQ